MQHASTWHVTSVFCQIIGYNVLIEKITNLIIEIIKWKLEKYKIIVKVGKLETVYVIYCHFSIIFELNLWIVTYKIWVFGNKRSRGENI